MIMTIVIVDRIERGQYEHLANKTIQEEHFTQPLEWEGTPIDVLSYKERMGTIHRFNPYALGIVQNSIVVHGDEFPPLNERTSTQNSLEPSEE